MADKIQRGDHSLQKLILGQRCHIGAHIKNANLILAELHLPHENTEIEEPIHDINAKFTNGYRIGSRQDIGRVEVVVCIPHEGDVNNARFCPQRNQLIATKTSHGDVLLFDYTFHPSLTHTNARCTPQMRLLGHQQVEGYSLSWNPNRRGQLLSGSYDNMICMWDIDSSQGSNNILQAQYVFRNHTKFVEDVEWFHFHESIFGSVGDDGVLSIWDIRKKKWALSYRIQNSEVNSLSFNPFNEKLLATAYSNGSLSIFDIRQLSQPLIILKGHTGSVSHVCFSPQNETVLASSGTEGRVCLWDLKHTNQKDEMESFPPTLSFVHSGHNTAINDMVWNPMAEGVLMTVDDNDWNCIWQPADNSFGRSLY